MHCVFIPHHFSRAHDRNPDSLSAPSHFWQPHECDPSLVGPGHGHNSEGGEEGPGDSRRVDVLAPGPARCADVAEAAVEPGVGDCRQRRGGEQRGKLGPEITDTG